MDTAQFQIIVAFLFYITHLSLGFSLEDKFRGIFIIIAGCTSIYLATILPLSPVFVLPLCVPVGLILIIYGSYILHFKEEPKKDGN